MKALTRIVDRRSLIGRVAIAVGLLVAPFGPSGASAAPRPVLPRRPLPADSVEGFGEGKVLAFRYAATYMCMTTPSTDVSGPFGAGNGKPESQDPSEYQLPPCFVGNTGTGSIPPFAPDGKPLSKTRKLYGIDLVANPSDNLTMPQTSSLYATNDSPVTDIQTQCAQPGLPYTQYTGERGTCIMHPSVLRLTKAPDPVLLPQHSHVIAGTTSPLVWWVAVAVDIYDRSIWPDLNGNCPAGRSKCVTSLKALRSAQARGLASPDNPSNVFFYFSVLPEANQPTAKTPATPVPFGKPGSVETAFSSRGLSCTLTGWGG